MVDLKEIKSWPTLAWEVQMKHHSPIVRPTSVLWGVLTTAIIAFIIAAGLGSLFIYTTLQAWNQPGPWLEPLLLGTLLLLIAVYMASLAGYCWRRLGQIEARHVAVTGDRDTEPR